MDVPVGYAAVGGFNANTPGTPGHVFQVTCASNCGSFVWADKSGDLPDIPVDSVIVNPNNPQQVFAGSDFGVYYTDDITVAFPAWNRFDNGIPQVMIWDMQVDRGATTLSVWTRGCGAFVFPLPSGPISTPTPTPTATATASPATATATATAHCHSYGHVHTNTHGNGYIHAYSDAGGITNADRYSDSDGNGHVHGRYSRRRRLRRRVHAYRHGNCTPTATATATAMATPTATVTVTPPPTPTPTPAPPPAPTALKDTNETFSSFTANWTSVSGATSYRLDVSTSNTFVTYVTIYHDLNVGNVTSRNVTGLAANTFYYYRVRAFNGNTSPNSNVIKAKTKPH